MIEDITNDPLLSGSEAARYLGVARNTFFKRARNNNVPPATIDLPYRRWRKSVLDDFLYGRIVRDESGQWVRFENPLFPKDAA